MQGRYGYYLFLGLGDYSSPGAPDATGSDWTSSWGLREWERRLDELVRLGTNTLFVYLAGGRLPYPSERFPELVEPGHPNVESEFFQSVITGANGRGIDVVAVLSTTGHAGTMADLRPELAIEPGPEQATGVLAFTRAFPETMQVGDAPVGTGVLCHHKAGARDYATGVARECLARYTGFAGYVLHPPEFESGCLCDGCQAAYRVRTGEELVPDREDRSRIRAVLHGTSASCFFTANRAIW